MTRNTNSSYVLLLSLMLALGQVPVCAADDGLTRRPARGRTHLTKEVPQEDLSLEPDSMEVFDLAVKEYAAGHNDQAQKLFQKVIELDPRNADAHFNLGAIHEWRNNLYEALNEYRVALKLKPDDHDILDAVHAVEYKLANKGALDQQKRERELAQHGELAKQAFAIQDYADAVKHLNYLAKVMPDDPQIQFALGQSLRAMKYYEWAAYRLKVAVYLDPNNQLYRRSLLDLDKEIQDAQGNAYNQSAKMAINKIKPFSFPELTATGIKHHD